METEMKKVLWVFALVIAFTIWTPTHAQTGTTGTWRVEGTGPSFPWEVVLRMDGATRVIGAVSTCAGLGASEISRGLVDGNTITFQCTSGDLQRTISFTGRISGDEIVFTWQKEVREGGPPNAAEAMF